MTVTAATTRSPVPTSGVQTSGAARGGLSSLDQGDFMKLMTVQMQQQDPFNPVDQKEMLAQMAQFSSLAGIAEMGDTLKAIAAKLDAVLTGQSAATPSDTATRTTQEI